MQGCRQLFGSRGGNNKVKTKELQFGSRGRVQEGYMPPPALCAESKNFLQNQRGIREQYSNNNYVLHKDRLGSISFEDSGFCTETSSTSLSNYIRIH